MAPMADSNYFPSLENCLNGQDVLCSWKSGFYALTSNGDAYEARPTSIEKFFLDAQTLELLSKPFDAFPKPSPTSKNAFETKTSAINVTPSSNSQFDIKMIKEDALWLSNATKIDELAALRIVVVECQTRSNAQLLGFFSDEELVSIREAAGNSQFSTPMPVSLSSEGTEPEKAQREFDTKESRRQRIVRAYLSERRHLLKCSERLFHAYFFNCTAQEIRRGKGTDPTVSWLESSAAALAAKMESINPDKFILGCIEAILQNVRNLEAGADWFDQDNGREQIQIEWARNQITEATHEMELIWQFLTYVLDFPSTEVVLAWFKLQESCGFFNSLEQAEQSIQVLVPPLQAISAILSAAMLRLEPTVKFINLGNTTDVSSSLPVDSPYLLNPQTLMSIYTILSQAADLCLATAGPVLLAYGVILQHITRRVNARQLEIEAAGFNDSPPDGQAVVPAPNPYADVLMQIKDTLEEDPVDFFIRRAVNVCQLFQTLSALSSQLGGSRNAYYSNQVGAQMRVTILDLLKYITPVGYIPELIEATISTLLGGQSYWDFLDSELLLVDDDPVAKFLNDPLLVEALLENAQRRYPYESMPFLQMIRSVASCVSSHFVEESRSALDFLEAIPIFTYTMPDNFMSYETTQEEENANNIKLRQTIQLFEPRSKSRDQKSQVNSQALVAFDDDFHIQAGTLGRIISDSGPRVAFWYHQYSGLKYFGKLLETFLTACDEVDATTRMPAERQSVAEIIEVLATLLLSMSKSAAHNPNSNDDAGRVLELASSGLTRNRDITTVVFDIFEQELQTQSAISGCDAQLDVLVSCTHFIHALIPISPGRVWPHLSRSALLAAGGAGKLSSIVENAELLSGNYDLLISVCRLYSSLVDDFTVNAIRRRRGTKSSARFRNGEQVDTCVPDHLLSAILLSFTRYLVDVLESSGSWRFQKRDDRRYLASIIGTTFENVLHNAYGIHSSSYAANIDLSKKSKTKIMEALMPSATHLIDTFLSPSAGTLRFRPLLASYMDGLETPDLTVFSNQSRLWTSSVRAILCFSKTLLRISTLLERPSSQLEGHLFKSSPLIARLYAMNPTYRQPVVAIFEAMIIAASNNTSEPPSLLGYLGPQTAKNFLHVLSDLDKPLSRDGNVVSIWHFLSVVVSNRQQWFANYLLTGKTPRDALKNKTGGKDLGALDKPLLTTALDTLIKINAAPRHEVLVMLEFVALAQNFWPWTVREAPRYSDFIQAISEFVGALHPLQQSTKLEANIDSCFQTRIAAYIAEILAMHLFHSRQTGTSHPIKELLPNLSYFSRFAVAVPSYNLSLHGQLKRNFEARYSGNLLSDLQRTTLENQQYGKQYFYDLDLADKMLRGDEGWTGRKDDGLRTEFALANVNLSLVDAQISLFQSWKFISIELSGKLTGDEDLQRMLAKVAHDCLITNARTQPPEEIFSRLSQTRADLALVLTQRLVQAKSSVPEMKTLLATVWDTIRALRQSFDRAVAEEDVLYYRSLLKLLFLSIRIHTEIALSNQKENFKASVRLTQNSSIMPIILDIIKYVICAGLRELASSIHESPTDSNSSSSPEDLALLTGILQSCLQIPSISLSYPNIVTILTSNSTPRIATTLFTWSSQLAISGDPIYGELSILFLLELSSMPLMAEQLAVEGLLGHIASCEISNFLRKPGVNPFAETPGLQRCYNIWAKGILPLLLNLLDAVHQSVAAEISLFLHQFPILIQQAEMALSPPSTSRLTPVAHQKPHYITLTTASELHTLSLILFILNGFRAQFQGQIEIPTVDFDTASVLENVEFWLGNRGLLRESIVPMGEREVEMARSKNGEVGSILEEKILGELRGIRDVLSGNE